MTKRFTMKYSFDDEEYVFFDGDVALTPSETVKLLNEQQATIQQLQREIEEWKKENRELLDQIQEFERIPKSIREQWVE